MMVQIKSVLLLMLLLSSQTSRKNGKKPVDSFWRNIYKVSGDSLRGMFEAASKNVAGPICYATCYSAVVGTGCVGTAAILPLLGFTSGGIAAGSFAAWLMSQIGSVGAGSLFATLQSLGATGATFSSVFSAATGICTPICAVVTYKDSEE